MSKLLIFVLLASLSTWAQSGSSGGTVTVSGSPATNDCAKFVSATVITTAGAACGAGGGGGTVTSVGWTGGLISVGTPTSTPAFTVAGTSGGIPYFDTTASWATSALLTNHAIVLGGGAGASPTVLGSLGTTTTVLHGAAAGAPTFAQVTSSDIDSSVAPTASPTFSGTPSMPTGTTGTTQTAADNSTKLATTAYVDRVAPVIRFMGTVGNQAITATSGSPANITGLSFTIPSVTGVVNYAIHCSINYAQGTPSAGDGFAIGVATNNPTRIEAQDIVWTAAAGTNTTGFVSSTTTGLTNFATFTPATSVNFNAYIDGSLEEPTTTANTLNVAAFTGNGSNAISIIRGSWCSVTPMAN